MKAAVSALVMLLLAACQVDVAVDISMNENGSGFVALVVTADEAVVAQAPGLADDLRFDDLIAAGWTVDGPTSTASGGLTVSLRHTFDTPEQATALVATLSGTDGPLRSVAFSRAATDTAITFTVTGAGRADNLAAFTDPELLEVVGATPYVDDIAIAGTAPSEAAVVTLSLSLPGTIADSTATPDVEGVVRWTIRPDGVPVDLTTTSTRSLERGGVWPWLSGGALVGLIAWVVASIVAIALVARARRRRTTRLRRLGN